MVLYSDVSEYESLRVLAVLYVSDLHVNSTRRPRSHVGMVARRTDRALGTKSIRRFLSSSQDLILPVIGSIHLSA